MSVERSKIVFLGLFCIKIKVEEISNFSPKRWTNPFGKILISRFSYTVFFIVFKGFFFIYNVRKDIFFPSIFDKHERWKNFNFLTKIKDYPLCKNANFALFLNPCLYCLERLVFERERHQILFLGVFYIKPNVHKISNFWLKPWTNPFEKMPILRVFERDVFVL